MANANAPKVGDEFFYLGRTRCTVNGSTLKPGGINSDEALIEIKTVQGTPHTFLYMNAPDYLSEKQLSLFERWAGKTAVNR